MITVKQIMAAGVFSNGSETHYAFRSHFDPEDYPQVHDFYEIILNVSGILTVIINGIPLHLSPGTLLLIRPGDIHSKLKCENGYHINLAFPITSLESLFYFLYGSSDKLDLLCSGPHIPLCMLTGTEATLLQSRLSYLNLLPSDCPEQKNTYLRAILTDIVYSYIMPGLEKEQTDLPSSVIPFWLTQALNGLSDISNLQEGMEYLVRQTDRTPEHICRAFRKYLSVTPVSYINARKLNYAANLLQHSDKEIIDIAFESGFQSISNFYHLFKREYKMSPLKYKNLHANAIL